MSSQPIDSAFDGLPKQFISSLSILFDILDERKCGFVNFADLEGRWQGDVDGLPQGVMESWRKVSHPHGKLTFERFLTGIKICLLKNLPKSNNQSTNQPSSNPITNDNTRATNRNYRPLESQSQPTSPERFWATRRDRPNDLHGSREAYEQQIGVNGKIGLDPKQMSTAPAPIPPLSQQRTFSLPHLPSESHEPSESNEIRLGHRGNVNLHNGKENNTGMQRKSWQTHTSNGSEFHNPDSDKSWWTNDPRSSVASMPALERTNRPETARVLAEVTSNPSVNSPHRDNKKRHVRRGEGRRHTVSSGADFQMRNIHHHDHQHHHDHEPRQDTIKRMKQLEQERDILLQGLDTLEQARHWYTTQLRQVENRQKYVDIKPQDSSVEAHQERVDFLTARIYEVCQQLHMLMDSSSSKGFPYHMNLAVRTSPQKAMAEKQLQEQSSLISRLKSQNKQLTQEVSEKSEKIVELEQEKAQVIREMFQVNSTKRAVTNYDDLSYI